MGGYQLKERWGQLASDLRQQWVKFREAHLVQDEKYDGNAVGQFPRPYGDTWGNSETGQRMGAVVSPEAHGEVDAITELSMQDRDTVSLPISEKELALTTRMDTTIDTALLSGGVLPGGAGDRRSRGSSMG
ncbi:MAG: hypothetical protein Q7U39_00215 [Nitrospira sp.]|nr:hypothetical protein [Nitrospira sp.]